MLNALLSIFRPAKPSILTVDSAKAYVAHYFNSLEWDGDYSFAILGAKMRREDGNDIVIVDFMLNGLAYDFAVWICDCPEQGGAARVPHLYGEW